MTHSEYETARNKLIPEAVIRANRRAGSKPAAGPRLDRWTATWSRIYHAEMNRLAGEAGLV